MTEITMAWGRGTKSYMDMTYRNKIGDRICAPHHGFWIEAKQGESMYEPLAGLLLIRALLLIGTIPDLCNCHVAKQDDERLTPENDFNAPFRFGIDLEQRNGTEGWKKPVSNEQMLKRMVGYGLLALSMINKYGGTITTNTERDKTK